MSTDAATTRKPKAQGVYLAIGVITLVVYVLLYPAYAILDYFDYVSSDHGIGRLLYYFFMPLAFLEQRFEAVHAFFKWLIDIYSSPFF